MVKHKFKIGQVVRCIKTDSQSPQLIQNSLYRIVDLRPDHRLNPDIPRYGYQPLIGKEILTWTLTSRGSPEWKFEEI